MLHQLTRQLSKRLLAFQQSDTKFVWILVALALLLLGNPFLPGWGFGQYVLNVMFMFIVLSGILVASNERQVIRQLILIGLVSLVLDWLATIAPQTFSGLTILTFALYTLFMAIVTGATILEVCKSRHVTGNTICGAIAGYLLIGLSGALLATLIETLQPGSFLLAGKELAQANLFDSLLYYSLVTLFTIGYGDIIPNSPLAQSLSITLGLLGQIYLTVLVAVLVGKYLKD